MLIFLCVCMSAHVCVCVCHAFQYSFLSHPLIGLPECDGPSYQDVCVQMEEALKRVWRAPMGEVKVLSDALRPITERLTGGEYGQRKYPQNDTCEMGDWVNTESCLMWGSQGNNCKRKRCGNEIQGCVHLHETLSRHQCLKYEFYSGRSLLNKCKALSAKCCTNQS